MLVKGLPLAYNRDFQEDKEPLFDAFDTVEACLELAILTVDGAEAAPNHIEERLEEGFLDATTLMESSIQRNVPQRIAHEVIGRLVRFCESRGLKQLGDLSDTELREIHPDLVSGARVALGVENAIKSFRSFGSTAPAEVKKQLDEWKQSLRQDYDFQPCLAYLLHNVCASSS